MLGKLIKWEFRAKSGLFLGMYFFVLTCALISGIVGAINERIGGGLFINTITSMCMIMTLIGVISMFAVIMIVSITRYYDNLVKDEGYLMHTLPVEAWQLHITKLVVPLVWLAVAVVIALLAMAAATRTMFSFKDIFDALFKSEDASKIVGLIGYVVVAVISSFSVFYLCINLGSLSTTNKGLMSFVAYIVLYIINQVVNTVAIFVTMFMMFAGESDIMAALNSDVPPEGFIEGVFVAAAMVGVIGIIVYNVISVHILKNKVNLE